MRQKPPGYAEHQRKQRNHKRSLVAAKRAVRSREKKRRNKRRKRM